MKTKLETCKQCSHYRKKQTIKLFNERLNETYEGLVSPPLCTLAFLETMTRITIDSPEFRIPNNCPFELEYLMEAHNEN